MPLMLLETQSWILRIGQALKYSDKLIKVLGTHSDVYLSHPVFECFEVVI